MKVTTCTHKRGNCPACGGTGGISDFGNWVNCAACKGTGNK